MRAKKIVYYVCVTTTAILVGGCAATIFVAPHYYDHPWIWSIEAGNILGHRLGKRMGTTLPRGFSVESMNPPGFFPAPPILSEMPGGEMRVTMPLWLFIGIVGTPAYIWWRRSRKKPTKPGHCSRCGYDLTGNTSGVCSECGEKTKVREEMGESRK